MYASFQFGLPVGGWRACEAIEPLLAHPLIEFVGEVNDSQKQELLANARALLFPIDWPEPFGLVMIEAMAAGTPVIAWPEGSVPEILEEGVTGAFARTIDEAAAAARSATRFDRQAIRLHFERRFTTERMAEAYVSAYKTLATAGQPEAATAPSVQPALPARRQMAVGV